MVRWDRSAVDQPLAKYEKPDPGDALSGHWRDRGHQYLGRPWHRHAIRANWGAVDRRRQARRRAERPESPRDPVLSGSIYAHVQQTRQPGMRGSVDGGHRPDGFAAG